MAGKNVSTNARHSTESMLASQKRSKVLSASSMDVNPPSRPGSPEPAPRPRGQDDTPVDFTYMGARFYDDDSSDERAGFIAAKDFENTMADEKK